MGLEETSYTPVARYRLTIAYDGTPYGGWQIQPNAPTVQEDLQRVLSHMFRVPIHLIGCSRTDRGVHAQGFVASFLVPARPEIPPEKLYRAVNRQLPPEIRLREVVEVPLEFHARYDAVGKAYTYILNLGQTTPFLDRYSWRPIHRMDPALIRDAAQELVGTHDYSSFVVERNMIDDAVRTIYRIEFNEFGDLLCITFVGNGFLYKMIRCLMGTLEAAGSGKLSRDAVRRILEAKNRVGAPDTAPPNGLFLMRVFYEQSALEAFHLQSLPILD